MLGSAVEPVTMATRPENRCAAPPEGASLLVFVVPPAGPIACILSHGAAPATSPVGPDAFKRRARS